jgi:hypothetical protein
LFLSQLNLEVFAEELQIFRFVTGGALYSLLILLLTAVNLAYSGIFFATGLAVIVPAFWVREDRVPLPDFPFRWKLLFATIICGYGVFYLATALAPEISPDGSTYHLGLVARYLRQHGLGHITTSIYSELSEGLEMLFLSAFSFGRHSAAVLVEFAFFLATPLAILSYARRFGFPKAGVAAAAIVFCSPVFAASGTSAYNDAAAAFTLFCLFYALQIWDRTRQIELLVVVGLLAGFGYGIKYSLFLATPYCLAFVLWKLVRARKFSIKPLFIVGVCALAMIAPWWIKNYMTVQNPLAPFGNKIFPNAYVTPHFENDYVNGMKPTRSLIQRFENVTIRGGEGAGFLGPLFVLTPLGLLALRFRQGRQVILAGVLFLFPALTNEQTRFLMLSAPFVAFCICLAFSKTRVALPIFAVAAAILSLPGVEDVYCDRGAWRWHAVPWQDALRQRSERESLEARLPGYRTTELIDRTVPRSGKVFSPSVPQDAYLNVDTVVGYESALGEDMWNMLWVPINKDLWPTWTYKFEFPEQSLQAVRIIQTAKGTDADEWSVGELKVFKGGQQLGRGKSWRLSANANPWTLEYAFDGLAVTRWRSRIAMFSGMRIAIDFDRPETIDTVELDCSHDQAAIRLKLEGEDSSGHWKQLAPAPKIGEGTVTGNLRRQAMDEFKKHGITHILLSKGDYSFDDFQKHSNEWGVTVVGREGDDWLYVIE